MANEEARFLTVREVAERLRLHPITVRRHIKAGRIGAVRIGRAVRIPEDGLREFGRMEGGGGDAKIAESAAVYRTRPSEGRARAGHRELTPEEPGKTPERFEVIRELKYGDRKQRTGMIQVTKSELVQRTKAIDALLAFRAKQKPLGMSTEELVREGRRELERRTDRHLGLDR